MQILGRLPLKHRKPRFLNGSYRLDGLGRTAVPRMRDLLIALLIFSLLILTSLPKTASADGAHAAAHQQLSVVTDSAINSLSLEGHDHQHEDEADRNTDDNPQNLSQNQNQNQSHSHNPFDHSHETQHLPPRFVVSSLEASQIWLASIHSRPPMVARERLDRPPTRLIAI